VRDTPGARGGIAETLPDGTQGDKRAAGERWVVRSVEESRSHARIATHGRPAMTGRAAGPAFALARVSERCSREQIATARCV